MNDRDPVQEEKEPDFESMKLGINNLIWMYGRPDMTLHEAEILALDILEKLRSQ